MIKTYRAGVKKKKNNPQALLKLSSAGPFLLQARILFAIINVTTRVQTKSCNAREGPYVFPIQRSGNGVSERKRRADGGGHRTGGTHREGRGYRPLFGGGTPHRRPADLYESAGDHLEADAGRVRRGGCSCRPRSRG